MKTIKVGSDFSGVGAFNQALNRLGINYQEVYACDMDKYARQTFIHNYGEPKYYPLNVYDREIPKDSLDIYVSSPPCQSFSMAGKRLGKDDKRGVLFFNSLEFIQVNKPRFFVFENVKGLLSDDGGKTFSEWVNMLGGKSVNGNPVIFAYDDSVPYHLYWKVLNAKQHGVPQNRERVFLIGIRDDQDNTFRWPVEEHLTKRLKDVLEDKVDDKYFLSLKQFESLEYTSNKALNGILSGGRWDKIHEQARRVYNKDYEAPTIHTMQGGNLEPKIIIKLATYKEYEETTEGVISYTRDSKGKVVSRHINQQANTIHTATGGGGNTDQFYTDGYRIRRLTPRECFRLMDFPDTFTWPVSDSQAYKQAGNSIVIRVLEKIIKNLPL